MGRWTPLILMGGGLAILLGTLLGINFPMGGGQQTASNNTPGGRTSRVLPANINVNSTAPSRGSSGVSEESAATNTPQEDNTTTEARPTEARRTRSVRQENLNTTTSERRTSVAQNTTPTESFSTPDNTTSDTTTTEVQSTETQSTDTSTNGNESARTPIRALW